MNFEGLIKGTQIRELAEFAIGDTIKVHHKIVEGTRERIQVFNGIVIGMKGIGINRNFTVRRVAFGEGMEKVFPFSSPRVEKVEVMKRGKVRRAKLYYLRDRIGKKARVKEMARTYESPSSASAS